MFGHGDAPFTGQDVVDLDRNPQMVASYYAVALCLQAPAAAKVGDPQWLWHVLIIVVRSR
jgi:hypothetical protein